MEVTLYSVALGIGLAAACGFRVFIPLFVLSGAAVLGEISLIDSLAWIGTYEALIAFGSAAILEIAGYAIPWVDNALDTIATPLAVGAGVLVSASVLGDVSPLVRWGLAVIAGGGVAGVVQGGTAAARGASSAATGGMGNIFFGMGELIAAIVTAVASFFVPLVVVFVVIVLCAVIARRLVRRRHAATADAPPTPSRR